MNELLQFYQSAIGVSDLTADEHGNISGGLFAGVLKEALVDGRRLILPTYENLRRPDKENFIILHPLKENVIRRGESKIMLAMRTWATRRAFTSLAALITETLSLALDSSKHTRLGPEQANFLKSLIEVDQTALKNMVDVLEACMFKHAQHPGLVISVRRPGANIGTSSRRVRRTSTMTFPLYDRIKVLYEQDFGDKVHLPKGQKLQKEKRVINGVEIRKTDVALFKRLFEMIVPHPDDLTFWTSETDCDEGPSFVAFLQTMRKWATAVNYVADLFEEVFEDAEQIKYDQAWFTYADDVKPLKRFIDEIPMQDGNEGSVAEDPSGAPSIAHDAQVRRVEVESQHQTTQQPKTAEVTTPQQVETVAKQPLTGEQPNIVLPDRRALPPVARPLAPALPNPTYQLGGSAAMSPAFNPNGHLLTQPQESAFKGNRLPSVSEIQQEEQRLAVQRMMDQREKAAREGPRPQVQQQQAAPTAFASPAPLPAGAVVHNGVVYYPAGTVAPQQQLGFGAPAGPLTLNHLVPQNQFGMGGGFQQPNLANPMVGRNVPLFGQTVDTSQQFNMINGNNGFGMMNNGRLM